MTDDTLKHSIHLADEATTLAWGRQLAKTLGGGMIITLCGDLGAGKTTLARGILGQLGVEGRIKSPTYALLEPYVVSNLYLYHFDFYRLAPPETWEQHGFRDYFRSDSLCLIEWPENAGAPLPRVDLAISLQHGSTGRDLIVTAATSTGKTCLGKLANTN